MCVVPKILLMFIIIRSSKSAFNKPMFSIVPAQIITKYNHEFMDNEIVKILPSGEDVVLNVTFSIIKTFPRDTVMTLRVQKQDGKKYVDFGPPLERNICEFIKNDKIIYADILTYSNLPKTCPLSPKEYHMSNYKLPTKFLPPILPVGNYKILLEHKMKNVYIYQADIFGKIVKM